MKCHISFYLPRKYEQVNDQDQVDVLHMGVERFLCQAFGNSCKNVFNSCRRNSTGPLRSCFLAANRDSRIERQNEGSKIVPHDK